MAKPVAVSDLGAGPDTYLYALAHTGNTFATIGSDDALRLFDPTSLKALHTAQPRNSGLSCLKPFAPNVFATAGRDGLIRLWDSRAKQAAQIAEPQGRAFSALACHEHILAAGTESTKEGLGDVSVLLFDARQPGAPLRDYAESHTDSITQLAFHPGQPNIVLSGSTDGLVSLFDASHADEEDALQQVLNPRSAVHAAGFLTPDHAYVLTTDEHLLLYPLAEPVEGNESAPPPLAIDFGDVREPLGCMYVIDLLRQPGGEPVIAFGHNERRTLSVVQFTGPEPWRFGSRVEFPGAHGDEVVRDVLMLERRAFSCGEDGQVHLEAKPHQMSTVIWSLVATVDSAVPALEPFLVLLSTIKYIFAGLQTNMLDQVQFPLTEDAELHFGVRDASLASLHTGFDFSILASGPSTPATAGPTVTNCGFTSSNPATLLRKSSSMTAFTSTCC